MRITNEEVRKRASKKEEVDWLGDVLRMDQNANLRIALTWVPGGRRGRGLPRKTWRRTAHKDLKEKGLKTWAETGSAATNRVNWKQ